MNDIGDNCDCDDEEEGCALGDDWEDCPFRISGVRNEDTIEQHPSVNTNRVRRRKKKGLASNMH